jgi:acyl-CoA reductase-like NAD-dependent aldehyde dehydrogenase
MLIGGVWRRGAAGREVIDPYRNEVVALVPESSAQDLDDALNAAVAAKRVMAAMPALERSALLKRAQALLLTAADEIAATMARETGKALADTTTELARSADTLGLCAEEAIRIEGEHVPLDGSALGNGKLGLLLRFPVGVVAGITPFNAPVNLACHKIGPALAAGNAIVLKAPPQASWTVSKLIEVFVQAGAPPGAIGLLYGDYAGPVLVRDSRVDFISFTGSSRVGIEIKAVSGFRRVALELGGNGATIVHADARLEIAAAACARNSMRLAGQSCISVQNVYVHDSLYDNFVASMVSHVQTLRVGDPLDPTTDVGTLINTVAAQRVEQWVKEALESGAQLHAGGRRFGAQYEPSVLTNVRPDMKVVCNEVFGPVVTVQRYQEVEPLFEHLSSSPFGLQCGLFTASMELAMRAIRALRFGGVIINGTSTWRADQMPYGGIRASGLGREGPRYAIRDMTDERLVIFNL